MNRFLGGRKKGGALSSQAPPSPPPPEEPQAELIKESQSDTESDGEELPPLEEGFLNHQAQELCREDRKRSFIEEWGIRLKDFVFEETVKGYHWDEFIADRGTTVGH